MESGTRPEAVYRINERKKLVFAFHYGSSTSLMRHTNDTGCAKCCSHEATVGLFDKKNFDCSKCARSGPLVGTGHGRRQLPICPGFRVRDHHQLHTDLDET